MKNFHTYKTFFKYMINIYDIVVLVIEIVNYKDIDKF